MNRDDIIRMARDLLEIDDFGADLTDENILRFAALVAAAEREACAKVCETAYADPDAYGAKEFPYRVAMELSQLIRARGEK